jgi:hypothetical protein
MNVVNTIEFNTHQEKYLDMAMNDHLIIQRGNNMLIVQNYMPNGEPDIIFEPDEDFYRSIPLEEVRDRIVGYIHQKHTK